ncbi:MAG: polyphosphate kinase 2 [Hyphomonadaceae bacterium]
MSVVAFRPADRIDNEPDWRLEPRLSRAADNRLLREWLDADTPFAGRLSRKVYEQQKHALQVELLKLQAWIKDTGGRLVVLFEGRDAAGKGGAIKRVTEHLNPRGARVAALDKPSDVERGQWYFQRYIEHLPTAGEIVLFDRSWYSRAGVERVMGFCSEDEVEAFMRQVVEIERNLVDAGTILIKFWLSVSREEQRRRFARRASDPLKQWKLSPIDLASMDRFDAYTAAERDVFARTARPETPWAVVKADDKKRARLNVMRHILASVPYARRDEDIVAADDPAIMTVISAFEQA